MTDEQKPITLADIESTLEARIKIIRNEHDIELELEVEGIEYAINLFKQAKAETLRQINAEMDDAERCRFWGLEFARELIERKKE